MTRIVFIGAGSVEFTRDLLGDILSFPELAGSDIVLHDISEERLRTAEALARRIDQAAGSGARISATTDRRRALDGADFAIDTIEVGGIAATRLDFDIPRKYGLRQTIADTSGVGAVSRALRTIPVLLGIADDMHELCPDAWMLNYTNPMAMNCWAWYEGSPHKNVVGLCHSIQNTSHQVCEYAGVPFDEVTFLGAGVNHMSWVLRLERGGESVYPLLESYAWPGNARELRNVIERMAILTQGERLTRESIPVEVRMQRETGPKSTIQEARESAEREHILRALEESSWNVSGAARALGMERTNLHKRIRALGLQRGK